MLSPARKIPLRQPVGNTESAAVVDAMGEWIRAIVPADVLARVADEELIEIDVKDVE